MTTFDNATIPPVQPRRMATWQILLIVATAIVGVGVIVIAGLVVTAAVVTSDDKIFPKAKEARVMADLFTIGSAVDMFKAFNNGKLPESLDLLVVKDENGQSFLNGLDRVPRDPWDHDYFYRPSTTDRGKYELGTLGADGKLSGEGENADVTLDSLRAQRLSKR